MKSTARLDSTVFHLTPTRTRFDLYIVANGKKEKLASGLLKPFLPHLKTAQEQTAKGGYSILLQPPAADNATWFTKATLERFVRFVSTPEILERVYTIECEIVQIEKAIAIQGNNDIGTNIIEDCHMKPVLAIEGSSSKPDANEEKAIVLYTPGSQSTEANASITQEGNPKVELLKVLDTRKNVLQKEQGMAFARATAAGFDMDHMKPLVSFAKCFGASRLLDASSRFMDLWKGKHESGQWLEIEAAETVSSKSEFLTMHASGIMLSSIANKHELQREFVSENDDKTAPDKSAGLRPPESYQVPLGQQEYFPGQFPHPMFPPWPMQSQSSGTPFYTGYPMQGTPYYLNYVGSGPYQQPCHQVAEDSQVGIIQKEKPSRQSLDSSVGNSESDTSEIDASGIKSQNDLHKRSTHSELRKKAGRSGKKQRDVVVIRNINYITSKQKKSTGSESNSDSGSADTDGDSRDLFSDVNKSYDKEESVIADGGHWHAFQSCLLRDTNEDSLAASDGMFASEKDVKMRRKQNTANDDPLAFTKRNPVESQGRWSTKFDKANGNMSHLTRASNDELSTATVEGPYRNGRLATDDMQFSDINGRNILRITGNDEFMVAGHENKSELRSSSDLAVNKYEVSTDNMAYMADESFIVPLRSISLDQVGSDGRANFGMDSEIPSRHVTSEMDGNQLNYESAEFSFLPERGSEKRSLGYDPALDYETHFGNAASMATKHEESVTDAKEESKNIEKKSKVVSETLDKKKFSGPVMRGKQSKLSPSDEARLRAEKLRTYKADLQKLKKEKEEAEHKRIEALKMERQKRITARGSSTSAQSSLPSMSTRKSLPAKCSPISHRGSKFSDSEPGSSSPLQRSKIRTASLGSADSKLASKISKSIDFNHLAGNRLTRSVSSLTEAKKEPSSATPDSKASMARIRKLSEPKTINGHPASSVKSGAAELASKLKVSNGSEGKKKNAIVHLDRTKAATLSELKTKTSKGTLNIKQKKLVEKDKTLKVNGGKSSVPFGRAEQITSGGRIHDNMDDDPVIEKTVVMLECQKSSITAVDMSEGVARKHNDINDSQITNLVVSEYATISATPSPVNTVDQEPSLVRSQEKLSSSKVMTNSAAREPTTFSSIGISEEPFQAPSPRVSSLEDPCTRNSEYGKVPASSLLSATIKTTEKDASHSENLKFEQKIKGFEKPQIKESSKGFRRFLKMGKKNHSSTAVEQNTEIDDMSVNELEQRNDGKDAATSNEGFTLKNLISQDETPTGASISQKSSRHFSLLSHFRSKTSEKKPIS